MAYALGRRLEYFDQPLVRSIVAAAESDDYRMQPLIMGVILSDAFRMKETLPTAELVSDQRSPD